MIKIILIVIIVIIILGSIYFFRYKNIPDLTRKLKTTRNPTWMIQLDESVKDLPINKLKIPGTHDSGMYSKENLFVDIEGAPVWSDLMKNLPGIFKTNIEGWSINQNTSVLEQLNNGIRYLDIRVAYSKTLNEFLCVHTFGGPLLKDVLTDIREFSMKNPSEVVLINFKPYYSCVSNKVHEENIKGLIKSLLSDFMVSNNHSIKETTLREMFILNKNIFLFNDKWSDDKYFHKSPFYSQWVDSDNIEIKTNIFKKQIENFVKDSEYNDNMMLIDWTYTASRSEALISYNNLEKYATLTNYYLSSFIDNVNERYKDFIGVISVDFESNSKIVSELIKLNQNLSYE